MQVNIVAEFYAATFPCVIRSDAKFGDGNHAFFFGFDGLEQVFWRWTNIYFVARARIIDFPVFGFVFSAKEHTPILATMRTDQYRNAQSPEARGNRGCFLRVSAPS